VLRAFVCAALAIVVLVVARRTLFRPLEGDRSDAEMALAPASRA
jgi:hypothetical protein